MVPRPDLSLGCVLLNQCEVLFHSQTTASIYTWANLDYVRYYVSAGKHGKHGCRKPDWLYLSPLVPGSCHRIKSDISGKLDSLEEWFGGLKSLAVLEPEVGLYPPLHLPLGELPFPLMPHFLLYKEGTTIQISNLFYFLPPWVQSFERSCLDRK